MIIFFVSHRKIVKEHCNCVKIYKTIAKYSFYYHQKYSCNSQFKTCFKHGRFSQAKNIGMQCMQNR